MRWIKEKYCKGEIRIRSKFLFFPKQMLNDKDQDETRWLEKASWIEEFLGYRTSNPNNEYWITRRWHND